ncbi:isocitrate lyase/phosphoenolpyruvate mutase family protein [Phenylobacterium terrae]|uniref:Isocitrate lyase/phosphoenolpyruvate mutase family protein n=1 Tax=Phenylobacterium terrae TaxID=2665495 RepID=A0ABW4N1L9_9CAUL
MDISQATKARAFQALHLAQTGFILPNAWDVGTALLLAAAGFPAVATTSAGIAFSLGRPDYQVADPRLAVSRDEMLRRSGEIAAALSAPVSADLEAGYGETPEAVAETVRMAIAAGLAGGNIEDARPGGGLYDEVLAAERIAAAREAGGDRFVLNARTDALQAGAPESLAACIRRANLYRAAGADCLFTPGTTDPAVVRTLVAEIDGPLNVVMGLGEAGGDARELIAAGVKRVTLGGSLARAALGLVRRAAEELRDEGTISYARGQLPQSELNRLFAAARATAEQASA